MIKRQSLGSYIEELPAVGRRTAILNCGEYRRVGWSYGDLYWAVKAFALEVTNRGLVKGDRVLLVGENSPGWVAAFLGCLDRGLVVVPLEVTGSPEFVAKVQKKVQAKLLVADPRVSLPGFGIPVFPVDRVVPSTGSFGVSLSDPEIRPDDTAEIVFTSGTTAEPKGVILTHQNILANLIPIEEGLQRYQPWVRLFRARRILVLLPLSHMFGQVIGVFVPIIFRWTSIFTYTFNPPVLIRTIRRYGVLALATVPRILQFLEEALLRDLEKVGTLNCFREKFEQMKGRHPLRRIWAFRDIHWRFGPRFLAVLTGGAALAPEQEEFWVRLGFAVIQGYGLTETAPIVTIKHPFKRKLGSVGRIVGDQEVRISPDGEILVKGSNVSGRYFRNEEATQESFEDGWFKTGDLGDVDEEGNLFIRGWKKEIIVTAEGINVYPEEIERAILEEKGVRDCVVIGLDRGKGEEVHAVLLLEDSAPTAEEIIRKANNRLTTPQRIRSHTIWPEADMPRGLTLKVKRGLVAAAVRAGEKGAAALTKTSQDRLEAILSCLSGELPADIDEQTRLADGLGLSSIDLIELTCLLEEAYQIELDDARVTVETSLEELRRIVQAPTSRSSVYPFPRWSRSWPVCLIRSVAQHALILPYIRFYCPTEVRGLQLLKEVEPPVIFTANHQSHFDTPVILALLPRRFRRLLAPAMAPDFFREYLQPDEAPLWTQLVKGWYYLLVVGLLNCYPFARTEGLRYNLQYTGELLDNGWCPLIFPEGRICPTEKIEPFKPGIGLIVSRMRVPVVPIRLRGTMEIFPRDATRPLRRGRVIVTIGEPLRFEKGSYREIVARIETAIRAL